MMRLNDFVELKRFANLDAQRARRNLLDQILKRHPHEVFRFACIRGQTDRSRYRLHGSKILEGPLVPDDSGHAHDATLFGAAKRVFERRGTNKFENFVDTVRTDFHHLLGD